MARRNFPQTRANFRLGRATTAPQKNPTPGATALAQERFGGGILADLWIAFYPGKGLNLYARPGFKSSTTLDCHLLKDR